MKWGVKVSNGRQRLRTQKIPQGGHIWLNKESKKSCGQILSQKSLDDKLVVSKHSKDWLFYNDDKRD